MKQVMSSSRLDGGRINGGVVVAAAAQNNGEEGGKHSCTADASDQQSDKDRNRKLVGPWAGGGREAKGACICQPCSLCATTGRGGVSRK